MGTVYIDRKDIHIKTDGNTIVFYSNGKKEGSIPISPLKRIVIVGNVNIETSAIHKIVKNQISVIFLTGRLRYSSMLYGPLHKNGVLRVKQYKKSLSDFALQYSKEIVSRKITAQIEYLEELKLSHPHLSMNISEVVKRLQNNLQTIASQTFSMDTLRGIEGVSSSLYFSIYTKIYPASLGFSKRTKRPPKDPVNAMLSLCYTLLHFELLREIQLIGLDPTIGFYHQFDYGRDSLACDLTELYRTDIDRFVYNLFKNDLFRKRDFEKDLNEGVYLKKSSRKKFYPLWEKWIQTLRPILKEEVRCLASRIAEEESLSF